MPKNTQTININFDASMDIAQVKTAVSAIEKSFSGIKLPQGLFNRLTTDLQKLQDELTNFSSLSSNMKNLSDIGKSEKSLEKIISLYRKLQLEISEIDGLDPKKLLPDSIVQKIGKVEKAFSSYQSSITEIGKEADATKKKIEKLLKLKEEHRQLASTRSVAESRKREVEAKLPGAQARATIAKETTAAAKKSGVDINSQQYLELVEAQKQAENEARALNDELKRLQSTISNSTTSLQKNEEAQKQFSDITETFGTKVKDLKQAFDTMGQTQAAEALQKLKEQLSQIDGFDVSNLKDDLSNLDDLTRGLSAEALEKIENGLEEIKKNSNEAERGIESMDNALGETAKSGEELTRTANEVERLKEQVFDFFSIGNSIELFKKSVRSAFDTVKELDKAMTETAVVTDFTIGDMWSQLPQYSEMANRLGTSILGAYEATTLYYQQGLKTNEVMAVSNETLKMARIASMNAADATDLMTAALRGFNMEINEGSAQRVNDVYSELAAVTAADTQEIGVAMSKTASIAASANMEFETTAALLSQIIETTREAPETAGTAMKTIIARFTEVKTLFSEGQLTGTDTEGEEININKIDEALKTVGISLKDFLNGTKGIDDIFLELASKWDTLDIATQRYIATTAAGSRQQSRFLAMMSNYDRTMELVDAAYNSTGASQEQFNKTLDSMESKLAQLKNAWDQFTMGLANNEILKFGVELLTSILTTVNKLIEALSGGNGLTKSFLSLVAALISLRTGKGILHKIFGGESGGLLEGLLGKKSDIKGQSEKAGRESAFAFVSSFKKGGKREGKNLFSEIFTPEQTGKALEKTQKHFSDLFSRDLDKANLTEEQKVKIITEYDSGNFDAAIAQAKEYGVVIESDTEKAKVFAQSSTINMNAVAVSAGLVGLAFSGIGSALEEAGNTDAALVFQNIGNALMGISAILPLLSAGAKALGVSFTAAGVQIGAAGQVAQLGWGWISLILGGVAALISGIVHLNNAVKENSLERKLEKTTEAAEKAKTAAEEAKAAYDDLLAGKSEYNETQEKLKKLTEGTVEFKEALLEANQYVLDLLEKFPNLKIYRGEFGQLTISNYDEILQNQLEVSENAQQNALGVKAYNEIVSRQKDLEGNFLNIQNKIEGEIPQNFYEKATNWDINLEDFAEKLVLASKGSLTENTLKDVIKNEFRNRNDEELSEEAINLFAEQISPYIKEINQAYVDNMKAITEEENYKANYFKDIAKKIDTNPNDNLNLSEINQELITGFKDFDKTIEREKNAIDQLPTDELYEEYTKYSHLSEELIKSKVEEGTLTDENIRIMVAENKAREALTDGLSRLANFLNTNPDWGESGFLERILSPGGEQITEKDLEVLYTTDKQGRMPNLEQLEKIANDYNIDFPALMAVIENVMALTEENKTRNIYPALKGIDLTPKKMSNLLDVVDETTLLGGAGAGSKTVNLLKDRFGANSKVFEAFSKSTLKTSDDVDNFIDKLDLMGLSTEGLRNQLLETTGAIKKVNLNPLIGQIKGLSSLEGSLKERGTTDRAFSEEEKNLLVESKVVEEDAFIELNGEYLYDGSDIDFSLLEEGISKAIYNLYGEGMADINKSIRLGEAIKNDEELQKWAEDDFSETAEFLDDLIEKYDAKSVKGLENYFNQYYGAGGEELSKNIDQRQKAQEALPSVLMNVDPRSFFNETKSESGEIIQQAEYPQSVVESVLDMRLANEGLTSSYERLRRELEKQGVKVENSENQIKALILSTNNANKSIDKMNEAVDNNIDVLKKGAKNSQEYQQALFDISNSAKEVFGEIADTDFVEKYKNDFLQLAEGGEAAEEAFNRISYAAGQATVESLNAEGQITGNLSQIDSLMMQISNNPLEIGGTADFTDIFNELAALVGGVQEAAAIIEAMGYRMEWVVDGTQTIQVPAEHTYNWSGGPAYESIKVPAYRMKVTKLGARGTKSTRPKTSGSGGGGGGGGSKKEKEEPWENPYDWLYNLTQDINEELRKREKLELKYNRILRDRSKNAKDLYDNIKAQTASLKEQERLQQQMLSKRQQEMRDYLSKNSSLSSYGTFNWADNTIEINWDKINSVTNQEKGKEIEEYISKLEEIQGEMNDAEDALDEIIDQIYELQQIGKDEFDDLESRTLDALIQRDQEAIDKLSNINESINNANQKLLDSVQKNLDKIRQDRQNEETEQNLAEKERQLAYLRQDTSGANAMQIRQLEEELANEQESYTDTLIDQKISELQQQNDEAAEQRERQIELAQAQLDYAQENGLYWQEAHKIMQEGVNAAGALIKGSELVSILGSAEGWDAMSEIQQMNWLSQLEETSKQALQYFAQQRQLENVGKKSGSITFTNANGQTLTGTVQSNGSVKVSTGSGTYTYKDVYQNYDGTYHTLEGQSDASFVANKNTSSSSSGSTGSNAKTYPYGKASDTTGNIKQGARGNNVKAIQYALNQLGYGNAGTSKVDGIFGSGTAAAVRAFQKAMGIAADGIVGTNTRAKFKLKQYKTGGLVDTTGLAWLDGTASNPEMVLRAKDTENFIQLKNILAEVLKGKENAISERSGDNYFEIYIEVDSLGNDYDVEQLAGKIKRMINEDARYRNVNAINILR